MFAKLKKGDIIKLIFFTRANGFKGGGYRILIGRCLFLKKRSKWINLHFCVIFKYIKFFFVIPLTKPVIMEMLLIK